MYENVEDISSYWLMTLLTGLCSQLQGGSESRGTTKKPLKQGTNQAEAKIGARSEKNCGKILDLPCYQHTKEIRLGNRMWNQCPNLRVSLLDFLCLPSNHSQLTNNIFYSCMRILSTHLNAKYYSYLHIILHFKYYLRFMDFLVKAVQ